MLRASIALGLLGCYLACIWDWRMTSPEVLSQRLADVEDDDDAGMRHKGQGSCWLG